MIATATTIILVTIINQILLTINYCLNITFWLSEQNCGQFYLQTICMGNRNEYNILLLRLNIKQNKICTNKISMSNRIIKMLPH